MISRDFILDAIKRNKIPLLEKHELSNLATQGNPMLNRCTLTSLIASQARALYDVKQKKTFDIIFRAFTDEYVMDKSVSSYDAAENALFWISVYHHYPHVACEESAYNLLHYVLKERLLL